MAYYFKSSSVNTSDIAAPGATIGHTLSSLSIIQSITTGVLLASAFFKISTNSATVLDDGVDFVKLAEAMGATGYRATSQAEFVDILKKALASSTPVVIDCIIDSDDNFD